MKKLLLAAFLMPASLWAFQKSPATKTAQSGNTVSLNCHLYGVKASADSVYLYESMGLAKRVVARAAKSGPDSTYVLTVPAGKARFYSVGATEGITAKVILGEEKQVTLWGNTQYMQKARTVNSPANKALENLQMRLTAFMEESAQTRAQYNGATGNMRKTMEDRVIQLDQRKMKFLDSLKSANQLLWYDACLQLTPDYSGQGGSEAEFYGKDYFRWANLSDPAFEHIPDVFSAFEMYISTMFQLGMPHEKAVQFAEAQLARIPAESITYRMAMGGIVSSLKANNSGQYPIMATKYLDKYRDKNLGDIPALEMEVRKSATFLPGFEAPELAGMTPDSGQYSLKQLRGNIVMIDFWASWCGPCRKENPNVVMNYNKYHSKGFDVLGVSLDREIGAWRNAIESDKLPWHHISDLKGWQSSYAALYSVTSIPQTVLIDKQGKIIARNLRGEELSAKLKEIFGE